MSNAIVQFMKKPAVEQRFAELLGANSKGFISNIMQITSGNSYLKNADPQTVYNAALMAATLNLSINPNLGHAYIVPYKGQAQFQLGYKGLIQLAQRSQQYRAISVATVYEGQLERYNPMKGNVYNWDGKASNTIIGFVAYFELVNGFEKEFYMTREEVERHAQRFSQSYKQKGGVWGEHFEAMAHKTVLKALISKFGPISLDMENAIKADQGVIKNIDNLEVQYVDNETDHLALEAEYEQAGQQPTPATDHQIALIMQGVDNLPEPRQQQIGELLGQGLTFTQADAILAEIRAL